MHFQGARLGRLEPIAKELSDAKDAIVRRRRELYPRPELRSGRFSGLARPPGREADPAPLLCKTRLRSGMIATAQYRETGDTYQPVSHQSKMQLT
jgi:hypothetical protein